MVNFTPFWYEVIPSNDSRLQPSFEYCDQGDVGPISFDCTDSFMNYLHGERNFTVRCVQALDDQIRDMEVTRREMCDQIVRLTATLESVSKHL